MDDEIRDNNNEDANEMILSPTRNTLLGKKRPTTSGASGISPARKQMMSTPISTPLRNQMSINQTRLSNETPDGLTYQLVHLNQSDGGQQRQQNIVRRIITTNGPELITTNNGGHQIVLNTSGGLTFGTTAVQESTPTRLAYVPANTISMVSTPSSANQPIQLQSFDNGGGQYYIMLPSGSEILQAPSTPSLASASATPTRVIAAPQLQPATFIPLSRLETANVANVQSLSVGGVGPAQIMKQLEFHSMESVTSGTKEVKRRASHNEVEKRRRDKINNWIGKLARIVPNASADFSGSKTSESKGGVLAKTVDFIHELRESNDQLVDTVRHYDSVIKCLQEEIKQLRDIMQQSGIDAPPSIVNEFEAPTDLLNAIEANRSSTLAATAQSAGGASSTTATSSKSTSSQATTSHAAGVAPSSMAKRKKGIGFGKRAFDNGDQSEQPATSSNNEEDEDGSEDGRGEEEEEEISGGD